MKKYYFTFCGRHEHKNGYVEIIASSIGDARAKMFDEYDDKWGFQYTEKEFDGQIEEYGLYKVKTII